MKLKHIRPSAFLALAFFALFLSGCRTSHQLAPLDLSQGGWQIEQGQAIWRPPRKQNDIAGELILARHRDGQTFVQFIKTPFPLVTARSTPIRWELTFGPQERRFQGSAPFPPRFIWLHLRPVLFSEQSPPRGWEFQRKPDGSWQFKNNRTGELLEGYFNP